MSVAPGALMAQDDPVSGGAPQEAVDEVDEIIVTGQPERGAVIGEIEPEQQLSPADVRALGVTSIAEIITELEPQTNGTPIILLNGKRISSFSEIRDIPSEAVARVDILPEQVALSYGYAPTQKVVNIVLRQRFRSEKAELELGTTTEGGRDNAEIEAGLLRIRGDDRFSLDLEYSRAARLLESERDIVTTPSSRPYALGGNIAAGMSGAEVDPALSALAGQTVTVAAVPGSAASGAPSLADFVAGANVAAVTDLTPYRTLNPATENFSANATLARALGGVSATINGRLELSENDSLQGLSTAALGLAAGSPFSPFAQDVTLYRYRAGRRAGAADPGHDGACRRHAERPDRAEVAMVLHGQWRPVDHAHAHRSWRRHRRHPGRAGCRRSVGQSLWRFCARTARHPHHRHSPRQEPGSDRRPAGERRAVPHARGRRHDLDPPGSLGQRL